MHHRSLRLVLLAGVLLGSGASNARADDVPRELTLDHDFCKDVRDWVGGKRGQPLNPATRAELTANEACLLLCEGKATSAELNAAVTSCPQSQIFGSHRLGASTGGGFAPATGVGWVPTLTDFFVTRLKGELMLFLQTQVAKHLCKDSAPTSIRELLPNTCPLLTASDGSMAALPGAIRRDLDALPGNLLPLALRLAQTQWSGPAQERAVKAVCAGAVMPGAYRAFKREGPLAALHALALAPAPHEKCKPVVADINRIAAWLEKALDKLSSPKCEPSCPRLEEVVPSSTGALVAAAAIGISAGVAGAMIGPDKLKAKVDQLKGRTEEIRPLLIELVELIRELKAHKHDTDSMDQIADRTMKIVAILVAADEAEKADLLLLGDAIAKFTTGRYWPGLLALLSVQGLDETMSKHGETRNVWAQLEKWGSLLASVATAKSADDAQKILESAAAPLGSYRAYRGGKWRGFISGYGGVTAGGDRPIGGTWGATVAPFLPVGFEVGHRLGSSSFTFNALLSIIDLGAPASARIEDDEASDGTTGMDGQIKSEVEKSLRSVFAPGAFIAFGLGNSPFVLGGGVELLPNSVRRFSCEAGVACGDTVSATTVRVMAFIAVDLTVFPIF